MNELTIKELVALSMCIQTIVDRSMTNTHALNEIGLLLDIQNKVNDCAEARMEAINRSL